MKQSDWRLETFPIGKSLNVVGSWLSVKCYACRKKLVQFCCLTHTSIEDSSERNVSGSLFSKNAKGMQRCFVPPFKGVLKRNSVFKDGS